MLLCQSLVVEGDNSQELRRKNMGVACNSGENSQVEVECYSVIFSAVAAAILIASLFANNSLDRMVNSMPPPSMP